MSNEKTNIGVEPVYDAKKLGNGRMLLLGFQHMFAMFGATVLVPILTGLNMQTTLLKVPAFLGSSFAFLGGYSAVTGANKAYGVDTPAEMLPYACLGVVFAGLLYLVLALVIKLVGVKRVMKFFPPVVTVPIIIAI